MLTLAIDKISIGSNRRPIKGEKVAELMESIKVNGLLNPITVDQNFNLVAGLHRLTACKMLEFNEIKCTVLLHSDTDHTRLAEIDENLIRSELDALDRAELWLERDRILESLGLRSRPGDNQYTRKKGGEIISPPLKTTLEVAKEAGYTDRTFQQGKQIAKNIVPEVKELIRGTPTAKSTTVLLKVARAGGEERKQAEQAEEALQEAQLRQQQPEVERQTKLIEDARTRLRDSQLVALQGATAEKSTKSMGRRSQKSLPESGDKPLTTTHLTKIKEGDDWVLGKHLIYCGDTADKEFIDRLPSDAALAVVPPDQPWDYDYLINEARVVAVLRSQGSIHQFCSTQQMPFKFEFMLGHLYLGVFSQEILAIPPKPDGLNEIEGIIAYLINLYTKPGGFVIAPGLAHGAALIACERQERICFAGDRDSQQVGRAIDRWQKWTGKAAERMH